MKNKKKIFMVALSLFLISNQILCPVKVSAAEETITLSGEIGDMEITSGTKKIILSGVTQQEDAELEIDTDIVIEIADGTENQLTDIMAVGNTEFTGSGTLNAGTIFTTGDLLLFDHTGSINVSKGGIGSLAGDIYFNSGEVNSQPAPDGDDMVFPVMTFDGSIYLNGGSLNAVGQVGAIYAGVSLALEGGSLQTKTDQLVAVRAGRGDANCITMSESFELGNGVTIVEGATSEDDVTITTLADKNGVLAQEAGGSGPDNTAGIEESRLKLDAVMYTQEYESTDEDDSYSGGDSSEEDPTNAAEYEIDSSSKTGNTQVIIIVVIILLLAATVGTAAYVSIKSKKDKKNRRGKKK